MQGPLLYKLVMSKNRKKLVNYFERNFNFDVCWEEKSTYELIWLWISESLDNRLPSTKPYCLRSKMKLKIYKETVTGMLTSFQPKIYRLVFKRRLEIEVPTPKFCSCLWDIKLVNTQCFVAMKLTYRLKKTNPSL